jgi:uncharacterized protein
MSELPHTVGTVASLWRYPVKSMAGERLDDVVVTDRGLRGDRAHALVDLEDGKVATAKNPRKWPRLFEFAATVVEGDDGTQSRLELTLPDGRRVSTAHRDVDTALSSALGRDVQMRAAEPGEPPVVESTSREKWKARSEEYRLDLEGRDLGDTVTDFDLPEGMFFDSATVHVLTTATLARLRELYPEGAMEVRRFRPNVVVDSGAGCSGFVEDDWVGRTLRLGDEVRLTVTGRCSRCVMTTLPQGDLPEDTGILRTAARHNDACVGVYAAVLTGGRLRHGDSVILE